VQLIFLEIAQRFSFLTDETLSDGECSQSILSSFVSIFKSCRKKSHLKFILESLYNCMNFHCQHHDHKRKKSLFTFAFLKQQISILNFIIALIILFIVFTLLIIFTILIILVLLTLIIFIIVTTLNILFIFIIGIFCFILIIFIILIIKIFSIICFEGNFAKDLR